MEATLNLHDGFGQCGEKIPFEINLFPAGECYINISVPFGIHSARINTRCRNSDDIMNLAFAVDSLHRQRVKEIELFIPYFPYSRQDRACHSGDSFSLKVICSLMESLNFRQILTYDIHSNVPGVLLDGKGFKSYDNHREVFDFIDYLGIKKTGLALICPDSGARKKTEALCGQRDIFDTVIYFNKARDKRFTSGVAVEAIENRIAGMTAIVVDDICDGGATFIELGKRLQEAKVKESYLFVSHGIFSEGFNDLKKFYKKVGTSNSMYRSYSDAENYCKIFNLDY